MYPRINALLLCVRGSGGERYAKLEYKLADFSKWTLLLHFRVFIGSSRGVAFSSHSALLRSCIETSPLSKSVSIVFFQQNDSLLIWIPCVWYHSSVNKLALVLAWHHLYYVFLVTEMKQDRPKETTCVSSFQQHFDSMLSTLSTAFFLWPHSSSEKAI